MSIRLYVVPLRISTNGIRSPKYLWANRVELIDVITIDTPEGVFRAGEPPRSFYERLDYGQYSWSVIALAGNYELGEGQDPLQGSSWTEGPYDAQIHVSLSSKPDVLTIPANLNSPVGTTDLPRVRDFLESATIPGQWINSSSSWREVVRMVCGLIIFGQTFDGLSAPGTVPFGAQLEGNLNLQWRDLPTQTRDNALAAALIRGYDTSWISNTDTIRNILKVFADLWGGRTVYFGLDIINGNTPFTV